MERPFVSLRPFGPILRASEDSGITVTILVGTETSAPAFGQQAEFFENSIQSSLASNVDSLNFSNMSAFPESLVALELKPESLGMTVIQVSDPSYTVEDAQSDLEAIKDTFREMGFNPNNTHIVEGDYFN